MPLEASMKPRRRAPFRVALEAAAAGSAVGVVIFLVSVYGLGDYGFLIFMSAPFFMGIVSGMVLGAGGPYDTLSRFSVSFFSIVLTAAVFMLFAMEGALCLAMAAPLAIPLNLLAIWIGCRMEESSRSGPLAMAALLTLPLALGADRGTDDFPVLPIVTTIEIDAPAEIVWRHVIDFEPLPPPKEAIFKIGIAHPIGARIEGRGVGAIRYCDFSTGPFVEPITVWDPPRRLAFDVTVQPDPMHEWSPYERIHAPHLEHGLQSLRGQFLLTPLPGGRTRLEGTTWYAVRMSPHAYWRAWSNYLIGGIHRRVLNHVKTLSERDASG